MRELDILGGGKMLIRINRYLVLSTGSYILSLYLVGVFLAPGFWNATAYEYAIGSIVAGVAGLYWFTVGPTKPCREITIGS